MLELFVNPFSMFIGAALISSPIIIHLINRMRFKRIRWAAMEFLLKAQKRNRRRLIIEQIILLLLRILLVLLAGLLLARFLGFKSVGGGEGQQTLHIILLDDTASASDFWRDEGQQKDSYTEAKRVITENIATPAAQASSPHMIEVVRLSDLKNPRSIGRVNSASIEDLRGYLNPLKPSPLHVSPLAGLAQSRIMFDASAKMRHVLHVVGDFRSTDWTAEEQALTQAFDELRRANIRIFMHDIAHPTPSANERTPRYHDNLAIVDLRPETRIAPRYSPVEFTVYVANYSNAERKNVRVAVKLNGQDRAEASVPIPSLPANEVTQARFTLAMDRVGTAEAPLERFNLIAASIENDQAGLNIDNVRYACVEVRDRVPMLLVEGKSNALTRTGGGAQKPSNRDAETFFLWKLFTEPIKGYDVRVCTPADLEKESLRQYVSIVLCDVPRLSDLTVKNLEEYVASGGGLAFFMGPSIKIADADWYNEKLYADGKGLFPAPIGRQPANSDKKDEEIVPSKWSRRLSGQQQIFPRDKHHPALEPLYMDGGRFRAESGVGYDRILQYVVIDRYFQVNRLTWKPDATVQEIMTLPNLKPMSSFEARVVAIMKRLPLEDEKYAEYREILTNYSNELRRLANTNNPLFVLARRLEDMLTDNGDKEKGRPSLMAFWQRSDMADLASELNALLADMKFGDPLYIAKQYGVGRVIACMSSAGSSWNDLEGLSLSHYPPLMMSLQRYLASASTDINLIVGSDYEYRFRANQYAPKVKRSLLTPEPAKILIDGMERTTNIQPQGEQVMDAKVNSATKENELRLTFDQASQPGVYLFEFSEIRPSEPGKADGPQFRPEYRFLAYNVDATDEGNLRRVSRDDLQKIGGKDTKVYGLTADTDDLKDRILDKPSDLSESPWFYLFILLILIAEQAMAVRLSFHTRPGDMGPVAGPMVTGRGVV